jgi:hypothetical protein
MQSINILKLVLVLLVALLLTLLGLQLGGRSDDHNGSGPGRMPTGEIKQRPEQGSPARVIAGGTPKLSAL